MSLETVTVRMSRSDGQTAWGFRLQGGQEFNAPLLIGKVSAGSLADRAGLRENDCVSTLCGRNASGMRHKDAQDTIVAAANNLDLVVTRAGGGSHNFTTPLGSIDRNTTISKFQHSVHSTGGTMTNNDGPPDYAPPPPPISAPPPPPPSMHIAGGAHTNTGGTVNVSLEHQRKGGQNIPGFNVSAAPFTARGDYRSVHHEDKAATGPISTGGMDVVGKITYTPGGQQGGGAPIDGGGRSAATDAGASSVAHLQYNSPMNLYSPGAAAQAYRQQTGGLFGSDPQRQQEQDSPHYLQSATLKLIQESETRGDASLATGAGAPHPRGVGPHHHQPHQYIQQPAWAEGRDQTLHHTDAEQQSGSFKRLTGALANSGAAGDIGSTRRAVSPRPNVVQAARTPQMGLSCTTCGSSTESEYYTIDGKPYCAIHARQRQGHHFGPAPAQDPQIFYPKAAAYDLNLRSDEPVKAFYQPDVMARGPVKTPSMPSPPLRSGAGSRTTYNYQQTTAYSSNNTLSPSGGGNKAFYQPDILKPGPVGGVHPPRATSPISPSMRGVPTRPTMYGTDLSGSRANEFSAPAAPPPPPSSVNTGDAQKPAQTTQRRSGTLLSSRPSKRLEVQWPPEQDDFSTTRSYWKLPQTIPKRPASEASLLIEYTKSLTATTPEIQPVSPPPVQRHRLLVKSDDLPSNQVNRHLLLSKDSVTRSMLPPVVHERQLASSPIIYSIPTLSATNENDDAVCSTKRSDTCEELKTNQPTRSLTTMVTTSVQTIDIEEKEQVSLSDVEVQPDREAVGIESNTFTTQLIVQEDSRSTENDGFVVLTVESIHSVTDIIPLTRYDQTTLMFERCSKPLENPVVPVDVRLEEIYQAEPSATDEASFFNSDADNDQTDRKYLDTVQELEELAELCTTDTNLNTAVASAPALTSNGDTGAVFVGYSAQLQNGALSTPPQMSPAALVTEQLLDQVEKAQDELTIVLNEALDYLHQLDDPDAVDDHQRRSEIVARTEDLLAIGVQSLESQRYYGPSERINQQLLATRQQQQQNAAELTDDEQRQGSLLSVGGGGGMMGTAATPRSMQYNSQTQQRSTVTSLQQVHGSGAPSPGVGGGAFRGKGVLKQLHDAPRVPVCEECRREIRGPFVLAVGKTWCPDHFVCANGQCSRKLLDIGFVEESGKKYCEVCFEAYLAPKCAQCNRSVTGDCLNALNKQWHPDCFTCSNCHQPFGSNSFFLENGQPYCEKDWNQLFTTKCVSCQFPIEAGDRWVEALSKAYHSNCFTCTTCNMNLEGASFYAKGGKPYCKTHA